MRIKNALMIFLFLIVSCKTEKTKVGPVDQNPVNKKETAPDGTISHIDTICDCRLNAYLKFSPDVVIYDTINGSRIDKVIYNVDIFCL